MKAQALTMPAPKQAHQCSAPGCNTLTTNAVKCNKHVIPAPVAEWAVAAQLRDEFAQQR